MSSSMDIGSANLLGSPHRPDQTPDLSRDVNNARFHLLLNGEDWFRWQGSDAKVSQFGVSEGEAPEPDMIWDEPTGSLMLRPLLYRFQAAATDLPLSIEARRGAARDRFGNWYWIDENGGEIRFLPACQTRSEHFWSGEDVPAPLLPTSAPVSDFQPLEAPAAFGTVSLRGLTVTGHHYLVVGMLSPTPGLLIFDLHAGGEPQKLVWPESIPFSPLDLCPAPNNGVWILAANGRYWGLDQRFEPLTDEQSQKVLVPEQVPLFHAEGETAATIPAVTFPEGIPLNLPEGTPAATSIEGLPDGSVLIGIHDSAQLMRFRLSAKLSTLRSLDEALQTVLESDPTRPYHLKLHDFAFLPDGASTSSGAGLVNALPPGTLFVVGEDGNQAFAFSLYIAGGDLQLSPQARYFPMRLFTGRALVACDGSVYYDQKSLWPKLIEQPIRRYEPLATLEMTGAFDGREPGCVWHRLLFDACIPTGSRVTFESRAADFPELLERTPWQAEPRPYRRGNGAELAWYRPFEDAQAQKVEVGTFELLLQRATGRFLQLRLTLTSTGRTSPRVRALRVYYPRFSYLREYLPAVYGDDATSASFLDRFLANVEGQFTTLEGRIAQAQQLLDTRTVPREMLGWLAGWLGLSLNPAWEEWRQRLLIRHAFRLFSMRGTLNGLLKSVRLAIDDCVDDCLFADDGCGCGCGGKNSSGSNQTSSGGCDCLDCPDTLSDERFPVRLVERYRTRSQPGVAYGDPTDTVLPGIQTGILSSSFAWTPAQGAEPLHLRYQQFLRQKYASTAFPNGDLSALNQAWGLSGDSLLTSFSAIRLSPIVPANVLEEPDWRNFLLTGLGFVHVVLSNATGEALTPAPSDTVSEGDSGDITSGGSSTTGSTDADAVTDDSSTVFVAPGTVVSADTQRWRRFLLARYRRIANLNTAWGLSGSAAYLRFDQLALPTTYPEGGRYLYDWIQLVSLAEPIRSRAHQFSLLVPVRPEMSAEAVQRRLDLARHIVEVERPAHTRFEVKPYWALFRVGEARLGLDTVLGEGSRYVALLLGSVALTEGLLTPPHPFNVPDRMVVGRDATGNQPRL